MHVSYLNKIIYLVLDVIMKNSKSEIAEILGAFIGDGWIESRKRGFYIMGSPIEDKQYYDKHLAPLVFKHFSNVEPRLFSSWKVYGIAMYKRKSIEKAISLGFPIGHKSLTASLPSWIMSSKDEDVWKRAIRGIFDTDGSFWCERSRAKTSTEWKRTHNYHPEIGITTCSNILANQMQTLLERLGIESRIASKSKKGFKYNRNVNDSYALNVRKIAEIEKWFDIIGTRNPRHRTRFEVWKKLGHLPPYTTLSERERIIAGI